MSAVFDERELLRYQRHFALAGFGPEAQEKLKQAAVLVIGAGGLGCPALLYLAAAGLGRITIIDFDRVDYSNLQRQVLFTEADVGEYKAIAAERRLHALNPHVQLEAVVGRFTRENALELVAAHDVIVDGSDNFATRYLANDACVLADKPLVYGAVQGFAGQVSVFNWRGGPTYRCLFPEPPAPGTVPNCAEAGVLGVLPGIIGTAQACEAIKLIAGIGEPLGGRLLLWDALTMTTQIVNLAADPSRRAITGLPPEGYGETCAAPTVDATEIAAAELRAALAAGRRPQLLDVREGWERALGSIQPSGHVPLGELKAGRGGDALAALDPAKPTVVYCAHGRRSLAGAALLREKHGFRSAVSLRGGYEEWKLGSA
jgi:molybdopterin/thiamine biosynthesis adenylyltransferase/rhodanese-related sulfurtransferase